jgi:transcription initiation factor TFIIB
MSVLPEDLLERNLKKAAKEINQICTQLGFSNHIKEKSNKLYKKALETGVIRGYMIEGMVSACVYVTVRLQNESKGINDIAMVSKVDHRKIEECYRMLVTSLKLTM